MALFSTSQMRRYSSLYFLASFSWAFNRSTSSLPFRYHYASLSFHFIFCSRLFRYHYASLSFHFIFCSRVVEACCAFSCFNASISATNDSFPAYYFFSLESRQLVWLSSEGSAFLPLMSCDLDFSFFSSGFLTLLPLDFSPTFIALTLTLVISMPSSSTPCAAFQASSSYLQALCYA